MNIDLRSDIYSLAVILYEMVNPQSKPPFEGTYEYLKYQHLQRPVPEITIDNENIKRVIYRSLEKKPQDRYANITELLEDLEPKPQPHEPEPQDSNDQTIARLWEEVLLCIQAADFNNTMLHCKAILQLDPEHEKAAVVFQDLKERFVAAHNLYTYVEENIIRESVEKLAQILCRAAGIYPDHPDGHAVQARMLEMSNHKVRRLQSRLETLRRDRQQRAAHANRNSASAPSSAAVSTYSPVSSGIYSGRQMCPLETGRKWYHKIGNYIMNLLSLV